MEKGLLYIVEVAAYFAPCKKYHIYNKKCKEMHDAISWSFATVINSVEYVFNVWRYFNQCCYISVQVNKNNLHNLLDNIYFVGTDNDLTYKKGVLTFSADLPINI